MDGDDEEMAEEISAEAMTPDEWAQYLMEFDADARSAVDDSAIQPLVELQEAKRIKRERK